MKFKFKIQQYQTDAVENTVAVFRGQPSHTLSAYRIDLGTYKINGLLTRKRNPDIVTIVWK